MRLLAAAVVALAGSACGGDRPDPLGGGVASLTIVPTGDIRLAVGVTAQVTATPKDASGNTISETVTWSSTNTAVATVASTGSTTATVTATGVGTAKVRATAGSVVQEINVIVQQPQYNANANSACSNPDMRSYKIETQTQHLLIVSDLNNPPGGFTAQDYAAIAAEFESLVWSTVTGNFGMPADIDGNGKVIAFYTRAVNELTPEESQSVVGGFFFARDLFPKTSNGRLSQCPSSNEAEMFYMLAPDPNGVVNGNVRSVQSVRAITVGVLGHEFQHLINSSRRLYVNQAATWPETAYMEEGLSHIAEELIFYEASGMAPRSNITLTDIRASEQRRNAFNSYMGSNAGRFRNYLRAPDEHAPYQPRDDDLETRGAIWSFLRYLADRGTPGAVFAETECTYPVTLTSVGDKCEVQPPEAQQFSVSGGTGGEFTVVAFAKDLVVVPGTAPAQAGSLTLDASATSTIPVVGPPTPWVGGASASVSSLGGATFGTGTLTLDDAFHARLRRLERRDLPGRVAGARAAYALRNRTSARMYSAGQAGPSMSHFAVEAVWGQLVNSNDTGIVNLRGRFGQDITGAAQDWAVAHYVDDVGLPGLPAQYTHPSWHFRSILAEINDPSKQYPLAVTTLTGTVPQKVLVDGGAAYYRFGVAAGTTATVRFTVGGGALPTSLKLVIVRTK